MTRIVLIGPNNYCFASFNFFVLLTNCMRSIMTQIKGKNLFEITIFNSPIENTNYKQLLAYKIMYRDIINNVFLRFEWNESLNIYPCFSLTCPHNALKSSQLPWIPFEAYPWVSCFFFITQNIQCSSHVIWFKNDWFKELRRKV